MICILSGRVVEGLEDFQYPDTKPIFVSFMHFALEQAVARIYLETSKGSCLHFTDTENTEDRHIYT